MSIWRRKCWKATTSWISFATVSSTRFSREYEGFRTGRTESPVRSGSRHLERIADHATNIAEDVLFWVRGLEVRHGRARMMDTQEDAKAS